MRLDKFYSRIGTLLPEKVRSGLRDRLSKAGLPDEASAWFGKRMMYSLAAGLAVSAIPLALKATAAATSDGTLATLYALSWSNALGLSSAIAFAATLITFFIFYMMLYYTIEERAERTEKVLPEFLMIVASNLRGGMTPFNAFKRAATPELGPLEKEILLASTKANVSQSISAALSSLTERVDSEVLRRTVSLFEKSLRAGGQVADLLTAISEEVRRNQELKAELVTSTKSYTMFLFFIIVLISPALLSVSVQFLGVYSNIKGQVSVESMDGYSLPFFSGNIQIDSNFATNVAYLSLIGTAFFSSVLMGVISRGKYLYGVKYFPLLAIGSVIAFQIGLQLAASIFSTF